MSTGHFVPIILLHWTIFPRELLRIESHTLENVLENRVCRTEWTKSAAAAMMWNSITKRTVETFQQKAK